MTNRPTVARCVIDGSAVTLDPTSDPKPVVAVLTSYGVAMLVMCPACQKHLVENVEAQEALSMLAEDSMATLHGIGGHA